VSTSNKSDPFVDEVQVTVAAGKGGDGIVSFRREKFAPRGGPNGGDGGWGGDVVYVADGGLATLRDQKYQREVRAEDGAAGGVRNCTGPRGQDAVVRLPTGTLVIDLDQPDEPLADLVNDGDRFVAARGGRGGLGNARFTLPTRQAPDFATPGKPGEARRLRLSLKLLADVGLVGLPNAGKSTLLRRISAARPRVADYPFTTLSPNLGVTELDDRRFVVADIPGLIEGASQGVGLGDRFLRHIERTRVLVHVLDLAALLDESRDVLSEYRTVRKELEAYGAGLESRLEIVALNKVDLIPDPELLSEVSEAVSRSREGVRVMTISGVTGAGIPELVRAMLEKLDAEKPDAPE